MNTETALYIHIPFCVKKCRYCDFVSFPGDEALWEAYIKALHREIRETAGQLPPRKIRSIFFGGGTPSLLPARDIVSVLELIDRLFQVPASAEISLEANPGTLTDEKLRAYRKAGINRLSIGLQTMDDSLLRVLGRIHTRQDFLKNYYGARAAGFDNINLDLMTGLPGQTEDSWESTLEQTLALKPDHISAYSLILEEGTPFYGDAKIRSQLPDEETNLLMYHRTGEILKEAGYFRYEFSNYARPGRECVHNLGYWTNIPYLGLGLNASSYYNDMRCKNTADLKTYLNRPFLPFNQREEYHLLTAAEEMEEFMFLGLRLIRGVSTRRFRERFGVNLWEIYGAVIEPYIKEGFLEMRGEWLRFSEKGIVVSNYILADFLL